MGTAAQIERAVEVLRLHGGFAEQHATEGRAYEIRDFGCVYREMVSRSGPCAWHEPFLAALLDADIQSIESGDSDCAACCRYVVTIRAPAEGVTA